MNGRKVLNFLLHERLGTWSVPLPPTHYFLQFFGKVIAVGKPQPMLLGYEQIIPATIGETKKLNYDSEASMRGKMHFV